MKELRISSLHSEQRWKTAINIHIVMSHMIELCAFFGILYLSGSNKLNTLVVKTCFCTEVVLTFSHVQ